MKAKYVLFPLFVLLSVVFLTLSQGCKDPCKDVSCGQDGTCVEGDCLCDPGFSGVRCEIEDLCYDVACENGGDCVNGDCNCESGYEGNLCESESRTKMIGGYEGADDCSASGTTGPFNSSISKASSSVQGVRIDGLWGNGFVNLVTGTVNGNIITIPSQDPDSDGFVISGSGEYISGVISWTYTVTTSGASDVCTMTATKS